MTGKVEIFFWGALFGAAVMGFLDRWAINLYRRWYIMVRNELERIDPHNRALVKIGARTSKREDWEDWK